MKLQTNNLQLLYIILNVCYNLFNSRQRNENIYTMLLSIRGNILPKKYNRNKKRRRANTNNRKKQLLINLALIIGLAVCVIIILMNTVFSDMFSHSNLTTASNGIVFSVKDDRTDELSQTAAGSLSSKEISHSVDITVNEMLLTPNEYSRPGSSLNTISGIVVHYTSNPGSTAEQNRDYFEGLKDGSDGTSASSHFIIGLDGEIIQCIPLDEISYASNERNSDTVSIECCHPDETGKFNDATYESLENLVTWLCEEFSLTSTDVIRHYDITGKICPKYFVEHEDAWKSFLSTIDTNLSKS